jgi:uncharacterized protein
LHEVFNLVFGTSTGAIIAALICVGKSVEEIHAIYRDNVLKVVKAKSPGDKSAALHALAQAVFGDLRFDAVKTGVGIVATKWVVETPMIFKGDIAQGHGRLGTFEPGFGVTIADAVEASCSAYPFFLKKTVTTHLGENIELIDGGYCANNPTLYALADAVAALKVPRDDIRVVSVGVGVYPEPKRSKFSKEYWLKKYLLSVQLLQKTLEINTQSMEQLRRILFKDVPGVRISDTYSEPSMATDLFEHDLAKLNLLHQRGTESFAKHEDELKKLLP